MLWELKRYLSRFSISHLKLRWCLLESWDQLDMWYEV
jgi:hypothetical protein